MAAPEATRRCAIALTPSAENALVTLMPSARSADTHRAHAGLFAVQRCPSSPQVFARAGQPVPVGNVKLLQLKRALSRASCGCAAGSSPLSTVSI